MGSLPRKAAGERFVNKKVLIEGEICGCLLAMYLSRSFCYVYNDVPYRQQVISVMFNNSAFSKLFYNQNTSCFFRSIQQNVEVHVETWIFNKSKFLFIT